MCNWRFKERLRGKKAFCCLRGDSSMAGSVGSRLAAAAAFSYLNWIPGLIEKKRRSKSRREAEKKQPFCLLQSTILDTVLSFTPQCNVKCCVMLLHEHSTVRIANSRYNCLSFSNYGNFSFRFQMKKATAADQNAVPFFFIYLFPDFWLLSHQIKWNGTFPRRWTFHSLII